MSLDGEKESTIKIDEDGDDDDFGDFGDFESNKMSAETSQPSNEEMSVFDQDNLKSSDEVSSVFRRVFGPFCKTTTSYEGDDINVNIKMLSSIVVRECTFMSNFFNKYSNHILFSL